MKKYLVFFLERRNLKKQIIQVILIFYGLVFMIHTLGCFWYASSKADFYGTIDWIRYNNMEDTSMSTKYITSLYWATVTSTTVGYGDILPTNNYELAYTIFVIVIGVAVFSFVISDLSSQFISLI